MNLKKSLQFSASVCLLTLTFVFNTEGQQRARVVQNPQITQTNQPVQQRPTEVIKRTVSSRPLNAPPVKPTLTNKIVVVGQPQASQPLVKKTADIKPTNPIIGKTTSSTAGKMLYPATTTSMMLSSIQNLYGIPYRYGSTGPNRYDCSGFVWTVFQRSGIYFERSSAANYWQNFEPAYGDDRFKFGTLVFFNRLGHVGIVADENGFYHASSSKGITYSPFKGYWEKRIVGYRKIPMQNYNDLVQK